MYVDYGPEALSANMLMKPIRILFSLGGTQPKQLRRTPVFKSSGLVKV